MKNLQRMIDYRLIQYRDIFTEKIKNQILDFANDVWYTHKQGGKILMCGNGGSAADSLHFTAELVGKFKLLRRPIASISLNSDVAILTAIANDFDYNKVFARQLEALADKKDLLVVISTSGKSLNVLEAVCTAEKIGIKTTALLGGNGGGVAEHINTGIVVHSSDTAIIQEIHQMIIHIICDIIDKRIQEDE